MEVRIDEIDKSICKNNRNIVIHVSHNGHMWNGINTLSLDDLIDLRKAIRKYIIKTKKSKRNENRQ